MVEEFEKVFKGSDRSLDYEVKDQNTMNYNILRIWYIIS
jgi:hypothetical protein